MSENINEVLKYLEKVLNLPPGFLQTLTQCLHIQDYFDIC